MCDAVSQFCSSPQNRFLCDHILCDQSTIYITRPAPASLPTILSSRFPDDVVVSGFPSSLPTPLDSSLSFPTPAVTPTDTANSLFSSPSTSLPGSVLSTPLADSSSFTGTLPLIPTSPVVVPTQSLPLSLLSTTQPATSPDAVQPTSSPDPALTASTSAFTAQLVPSVAASASPQEALAPGHSNHTGAIVGGVLGGLAFLILLIALFVMRKRMMRDWESRRRHRMAPSAEFMGRATPFSPSPGSQMRTLSAYGSIIGGSRNASPFADPVLGSVRSNSLYRDDGGFAVIAAGAGMPEASTFEPPPPFTTGSFSDPLYEKLSDAARQREEYYRATTNGGPLPPTPLRNDSGQTYDSAIAQSASTVQTRTTRTSEQELYNPYLNTYSHESDGEDMEQTSPILQRTNDSYDGVRQSMAGEVGWAV